MAEFLQLSMTEPFTQSFSKESSGLFPRYDLLDDSLFQHDLLDRSQEREKMIYV